MPLIFNAIEGIFDFTRRGTGGGGGPSAATEAPKLIEEFDSDVSTVAGDLVVIDASNTVTRILDNDSLTMPNGVFGVCTSKPSPTRARVTFIGIQTGYSGFTPGLPLFVSTLGVPTHTVPLTGMVQQIGFAISSSALFLNLMQAIRRS